MECNKGHLLSMSVIPLVKPAESLLDSDLLAQLNERTGNFLYAVFEHAPDGIILVAQEGDIAFMNRRALDAMEAASFDQIDGKSWAGLWPADKREMVLGAVEQAAWGVRTSFEGACPTLQGNMRWWSVDVCPIEDHDGVPVITMVTMRDVSQHVTDRKLLDERTGALRLENARLEARLEHHAVQIASVDHRAKNSFALVSSVLRLQAEAESEPTARTNLAEAADRVLAMAEVHNQLSMTDNSNSVSLPAFLSALITQLCEVNFDRITITEGELADIALPAKRALAIAMIVTELVGMSVRAAPSNMRAEVRYDLTLQKGTAILTLTERNMKLPANFSLPMADGMGFRICRTYASQLDAALSHTPNSPSGAIFTLAFNP